jgi:hypothetical protein
MKAWQIFVVGVAVLIAVLLLPSYEAILAGLAAIALVAVVVVGFLLRPRKEIFYLPTTLVISEPDFPISVEHDRVAVRVELARLWLLFLPTFAAVAFFIITSAKGTTWNFDLLDRNFDLVDSFLYWNGGSFTYFIVLAIRTLDIAVVGLLSAWVSERWVLRDAEACSADTVSIMAGCLRYSFRDRLGEYYGGDGFPFASVRSPKLARIVFYRAAKPELNKIALACIFHRLVIVGRGLTDLDEATMAGHPVEARPASQPL